MKNKVKNLFSLMIFFTAIIQISSCNYYSLDVVCGKSSLTETEALGIAAKRLEDFCERKEINRAEFSAPTISKQADIPWIIDYTSGKDDGNPYYTFRVTIDNCGRIEKSRQQYPLKYK